MVAEERDVDEADDQDCMAANVSEGGSQNPEGEGSLGTSDVNHDSSSVGVSEAGSCVTVNTVETGGSQPGPSSRVRDTEILTEGDDRQTGQRNSHGSR